MQRVLVIGPCGAGKSTLARELGPLLGLPVIHLDKLHWRPGWVEGSKAELLADLAREMAAERWLVDGNYGSTMEPRLALADTVIYLDFPVWLCLWRIVRRWWRWRGQSRPDMTQDCPERLDPAFLWYVLRWNSGPGPRTERLLQGFAGHIIRLKSPHETERWLASLRAAQNRRDS